MTEIALDAPKSQVHVARQYEEVADAALIKARLRRSTRMAKIRALLLVAPLFAFILITFVIPIANMLFRSVDNPEVVTTIPRTANLLQTWEGPEPPSEEVFTTLAEEIRVADENRTLGELGTRLNYEVSGASSLMRKTGRRIDRIEPPYREAFIDIDEDWADPAVWQTIKRLSAPVTAGYYLAAIDMRRAGDGSIEMQPDYRQIYLNLFWRTLWLSTVVTVLTLALGYPVAYLLATLQAKYANLLMILVLLPFWTSLLVRTTSWIVLLQTEGVLNDLLVWLGIIGDDGRIRMIYNQIGTIVAMTHILLPFMILPLYSVMKTIPPSYLRAARSLGANPAVAYWRVYVPQTVPGIGAGAILVFILAIGYYITPALVGGDSGQLISNMIAYHMQSSLNWGLAAALGTILLGTVLVLYFAYSRVVGVENMKLG